jgi:branched-subunit amino acid aminotransferase/4-amino-4-deoxychorismate lyase
MQTVPADDRGLTLGVGLFETVLALGGRLAHWEAHLDRLARGCAALGLPAPDRALCAARAHEALARTGLEQGRAAVRLTLTGGSGARGLAAPTAPEPRLLVTTAPAAPPPASLALKTVAIRRNPTSPAARMKTLNYLDNVQARAEATSAGADEALMLDPAGDLACAAAANLFWLEGLRLCTPAPDCGVLDGIVRAEVLRLAPTLGLTAEQVHAAPARLLASDGVFLTNSLQGAVAARSLDGAPLPACDPALLARLTLAAEAR